MACQPTDRPTEQPTTHRGTTSRRPQPPPPWPPRLLLLLLVSFRKDSAIETVAVAAAAAAAVVLFGFSVGLVPSNFAALESTAPKNRERPLQPTSPVLKARREHRQNSLFKGRGLSRKRCSRCVIKSCGSIFRGLGFPRGSVKKIILFSLGSFLLHGNGIRQCLDFVGLRDSKRNQNFHPLQKLHASNRASDQ